jgi:hypothetical protein
MPSNLSHAHIAFFALFIFWIGPHVFALVWPWTAILLPKASFVAGTTDMYHHVQFVGWDGNLTNFLPALAQNCNPSDLHLTSSWDYRYEPLHPTNPLSLFVLVCYSNGELTSTLAKLNLKISDWKMISYCWKLHVTSPQGKFPILCNSYPNQTALQAEKQKQFSNIPVTPSICDPIRENEIGSCEYCYHCFTIISNCL